MRVLSRILIVNPKNLHHPKRFRGHPSKKIQRHRDIYFTAIQEIPANDYLEDKYPQFSDEFWVLMLVIELDCSRSRAVANISCLHSLDATKGRCEGLSPLLSNIALLQPLEELQVLLPVHHPLLGSRRL